jgi:hypothetical protein
MIASRRIIRCAPSKKWRTSNCNGFLPCSIKCIPMPGGNIHTVPINRIPFLNNIPEINSDTKFQPPGLLQKCVFRTKHLLDLYGALHRIRLAGKISEDVVSRRTHHSAPVLSHQVPNQHLAVVQRPLLILTPEATLALDISTQDGRELPFYLVRGHGVISSKFYKGHT